MWRKVFKITCKYPLFVNIRESRIKTQLIETGEFNMTQISYMVGINDPRYFSKCFKQRFGMTPTEYREKQKNK